MNLRKILQIISLIFLLASCAGDSTGSVDSEPAAASDSSSNSSSNSNNNNNSSTVVDPVADPTYGSISGIVSDASTGNPLSGVTLYISGDQSNTETTSSASGTYSISNISTGTVSLVASKSAYNSQTVSVEVSADTTTENTNLSMVSTAYGGGMYVIILSWATDPQDLDAHLHIPTNASGIDHVYYDDPGDNDGTIDDDPYSALDVDDTDGEGPETIRITKNGSGPKYNGSYRYYVHNFGGSPTAEFATSGAVVRVYNNGSLVKTYNVPTTNNSNRYWHVFDMSSTGSITDVNTTSNTEPTNPNP